jgi:hypothetical protein
MTLNEESETQKQTTVDAMYGCTGFQRKAKAQQSKHFDWQTSIKAFLDNFIGQTTFMKTLAEWLREKFRRENSKETVEPICDCCGQVSKLTDGLCDWCSRFYKAHK